MYSLSSSDFSSLVTFATFMASFQSPFSTYIAEYKGSGSYVPYEVISFISLAAAALLGVVENPTALPILVVGVVFALLTYLAVLYEENLVSRYSDA